MTVKTEWTLKKWHLYIAVLALAITVLSSFASVVRGYAVDSTSIQRSVETNTVNISTNTTRISSLEQARVLDHNVLLELKINMKHQMKAQGLEYQEVTP